MPGFSSVSPGIGDSADIENFTGATFATSTTGAQSGVLNEGLYRVHADVLTFIKVGATASDVTAANGCPLGANQAMNVAVRQGSRIGAILGTGTGNVYFHRVA
jgi:hypothetical protein